jgi:hypothetical protein
MDTKNMQEDAVDVGIGFELPPAQELRRPPRPAHQIG